jgi:hypothetical protein
VGFKAAATLGGRAVAAEEAKAPVWRSGRWRSRRWRSQGTDMEESGGSGSSIDDGHNCGGVRADRRRRTHRSVRPSERKRERVGAGQGAWLWLSPLSSVDSP